MPKAEKGIQLSIYKCQHCGQNYSAYLTYLYNEQTDTSIKKLMCIPCTQLADTPQKNSLTGLYKRPLFEERVVYYMDKPRTTTRCITN